MESVESDVGVEKGNHGVKGRGFSEVVRVVVKELFVSISVGGRFNLDGGRGNMLR